MTAVEWLHEKLAKSSQEELVGNINLWFKEAKEMERQQIVMAFWNSKHSLCDENTDLLYLAEQYYNAKFNK
jgi:hypothetical protein